MAFCAVEPFAAARRADGDLGVQDVFAHGEARAGDTGEGRKKLRGGDAAWAEMCLSFVLVFVLVLESCLRPGCRASAAGCSESQLCGGGLQPSPSTWSVVCEWRTSSASTPNSTKPNISPFVCFLRSVSTLSPVPLITAGTPRSRAETLLRGDHPFPAPSASIPHGRAFLQHHAFPREPFTVASPPKPASPSFAALWIFFLGRSLHLGPPPTSIRATRPSAAKARHSSKITHGAQWDMLMGGR